MYALGYLLGCIIGFIILHYVAKQFYAVAVDKGYPERKYFHICFWLGLVGYLLVIALPDRNRDQVRTTPPVPIKAAPSQTQEAPAPVDNTPDFENVQIATALIVGENNIKCNNCQRVQFRGNRSCNRCGAKFVELWER